MTAWKDISSFSRSDKDRTPQTFELKIGFFRVVVTRHIDHPPDVWTVVCRELGITTTTELQSKDIERAKEEALILVESRLEKALKGVRDAIVAGAVQ